MYFVYSMQLITGGLWHSMTNGSENYNGKAKYDLMRDSISTITAFLAHLERTATGILLLTVMG